MPEENSTIEVTQDSPESENLSLQQFRETRQGKTVTVPKEAPLEVVEEKPVFDLEQVKAEEAEKLEKVEEQKVEEKAKRDPKKRIEKITREKYEAEAERDELKAKLAKYEGVKTETKPSSLPSFKEYLDQRSKESPGKLSYEEILEEWTDKKAKQTYDSLREGESKAAREATEQARAKEVWDGHLERMKEARAKYEDLDDVVSEAKFDVSPAAANSILELENGPEVMYHIATHPEELEKLSKMTPLRQIARLGAISESLLPKEPVKEIKPVESKAPAPIKPVTTSGKSNPLVDEMSLADYKKYRASQSAS